MMTLFKKKKTKTKDFNLMAGSMTLKICLLLDFFLLNPFPQNTKTEIWYENN